MPFYTCGLRPATRPIWETRLYTKQDRLRPFLFRVAPFVAVRSTAVLYLPYLMPRHWFCGSILIAPNATKILHGLFQNRRIAEAMQTSISRWILHTY